MIAPGDRPSPAVLARTVHEYSFPGFDNVGEPGGVAAPEPATVTVTVASYGASPLDAVLAEYQRSHPDVRIEVVGGPEGASSYRPTIEDDVGGSDLADVVLISVDSLATVFANADRFADLVEEDRSADPLAWASARGTDGDGRVLAVPVTVDPAALCFRADLLAEAGIADGLSAREHAWHWDEGRAFVDGSFATFLCPPWMLGIVETNVVAGGGDASTGWDVADVFPGGGWSWGGVYAAGAGVPSDPQAAANVADDPAPHPFFNDAPVGTIFASRAEHMPSDVLGPEELHLALEVVLPALHALDTGTADAATAWADAMDRLAEQER